MCRAHAIFLQIQGTSYENKSRDKIYIKGLADCRPRDRLRNRYGLAFRVQLSVQGDFRYRMSFLWHDTGTYLSTTL